MSGYGSESEDEVFNPEQEVSETEDQAPAPVQPDEDVAPVTEPPRGDDDEDEEEDEDDEEEDDDEEDEVRPHKRRKKVARRNM